MTQTKIIEALEATIAQAKVQIEQLKQPEFTYPMWFKLCSGLVVKFMGLTYGTVVVVGNSSYVIGQKKDNLSAHTFDIWTQIDEPIKQWGPQWEPQGGEYWVSADGSISESVSEESCRLFGAEYNTRERAEWASKQMRKFNRLLCYVADNLEIEPSDISISTDSFYITITVPTSQFLLAELEKQTKLGNVIL